MSTPSSFADDLSPALVAGLRRGEPAAQHEVYRRFERPAFSLAVRVLGHPEDALEVLHDAFLQAFQRIGSWRSEAPFWAWFRQITLNQALMRLRQRRPESEFDEQDEVVGDATPFDLGPLLAAELHQLERALARLPPNTRSVIWLYHAEGMTHEEIACSLGRSVSFSKSQLARGLRRLRQLLQIHQEATSHA